MIRKIAGFFPVRTYSFNEFFSRLLDNNVEYADGNLIVKSKRKYKSTPILVDLFVGTRYQSKSKKGRPIIYEEWYDDFMSIKDHTSYTPEMNSAKITTLLSTVQRFEMLTYEMPWLRYDIKENGNFVGFDKLQEISNIAKSQGIKPVFYD